MTTYNATIERAGDWWAISVEGVPFAHTQTKRLDQADAMVRSVLVDLEVESDPHAFDVVLHAPGRVEEVVAPARRARRALIEAEARAADATTDAVMRLRRDGYSLRDLAVLLGLSYQRVAQIEQTARTEVVGALHPRSRRRIGAGDRIQEGLMSEQRDVVPNSDRGWDVRAPGAKRASSHHATQAEAVARAREILERKGGGELVTHGRDGKIRGKDTIAPGNDPYPPKG